MVTQKSDDTPTSFVACSKRVAQIIICLHSTAYAISNSEDDF
jgi:hypothetical protein